MKRVLKYLVDKFLSILRKIRYKKINVDSDIETVEKILKNQSSICRFGDGEFSLMLGRDIAFQKASIPLANKLIEIASNKCENLIVGVPNIFMDNKLMKNIYSDKEYAFWIKVKNRFEGTLRKYFCNSPYGNAFITRFYMNKRDKSSCKIYIERFKDIWKERKILIVEGTKSRVGVNNDLFSQTLEIKRILCSPINAFEQYDSILKSITKFDKDYLIIIALGPTATVLAYDLAQLKYQALDLGHLDIEYDWFNLASDSKLPIKNKYTSECGYFAEESFDCKEYEQQIVVDLTLAKMDDDVKNEN